MIGGLEYAGSLWMLCRVGLDPACGAGGAWTDVTLTGDVAHFRARTQALRSIVIGNVMFHRVNHWKSDIQASSIAAAPWLKIGSSLRRVRVPAGILAPVTISWHLYDEPVPQLDEDGNPVHDSQGRIVATGFRYAMHGSTPVLGIDPYAADATVLHLHDLDKPANHVADSTDLESLWSGFNDSSGYFIIGLSSQVQFSYSQPFRVRRGGIGSIENVHVVDSTVPTPSFVRATVVNSPISLFSISMSNIDYGDGLAFSIDPVTVATLGYPGIFIY